MTLNSKQKRFIERNIRTKTAQELSDALNVPLTDVINYSSNKFSLLPTKTYTAQSFFAIKSFRVVFFTATLVLLAKLTLSFFVYGTNDVTYWLRFTDIIHKYGSVKLYAMDKVFNHPPLLAWILPIIDSISKLTNLSFPFIFRLMPIFADFLCVFVIWKLLNNYKPKLRMQICVLAALNPINFFVSGFHGNTDPIFSFLIILSIYCADRNKTFISGMIYGFSMCFKIVPVMLFPAFFFSFKNGKEKIHFVIATSLIPFFVFFPYLLADFKSVSSNIFGWGGLPGIWGIGHLLRSIFSDELLDLNTRKFFYNLFKLHILIFKPVFIIFLVTFFYYLSKKKPINRLESAFLTFAIFFSCTPGFGVQYLSYISTLSIILSPVLSSIYTFTGGIFLYRVYTFWSGGFPLNNANSDKVGQWKGFDETLDIILWIILCVMLLFFLIAKKIIPVRFPLAQKLFKNNDLPTKIKSIS